MKNEYQVLKQARQLLEKGWTQRRTTERLPSGTSYCALGAIGVACYKPGGYDGAAFDAACSVLRNTIQPNPDSPMSLVAWNDDKTRTKDQILDAFGAAVERERQKLPWWQRVFTPSE